MSWFLQPGGGGGYIMGKESIRENTVGSVGSALSLLGTMRVRSLCMLEVAVQLGLPPSKRQFSLSLLFSLNKNKVKTKVRQQK